MVIREFSSIDEAATCVVLDLLSSILFDVFQAGRTTLTLPGGSTAIPVFKQLAVVSVPWEKVTVLLSDDRLVPVTDDRSNEGMLNQFLLSKLQCKPNYVSLTSDGAIGNSNLRSVEQRLLSLSSLPGHVLLGMGLDGHIASLFSSDDLSRKGIVCFTQSPDGMNRISLTSQCLFQATKISLLFAGQSKRAIFEQAKSKQSKLPVATLLHNCSDKLSIYCC
jgi:6-phosphogluconolactonase